MANVARQRIANLLAKRVVTAPAARPEAPAAPVAPVVRSNARFLTRPEGRIAYDDRGSGPLVVMVPSLGDVRQEYRLLAPIIVSSGFRVVSMDLRGHGESSVGWSEYTNAAIGRDILELVRSLDAGPAILVGTSMGAGAAAWAAAEDPAAVAGLVLISPFVRQIPMPWWKKALMQAVIRTAFVGPWGAKAWAVYYATLYKRSKPADFAAYQAALVANLKEPGRLAALQGTLRATKADVEMRLDKVRAPTLVVMGSKDPDFADPEIEALAIARILRGRTAMVENAGHYPHVEVPLATASMMGPFLAGLAPKPPRADG
jgi:pimeloyl-ACP methyl ester carboxylesterase